MSIHVSRVDDIVISPAMNRDKERIVALVIRILQEFGFQPDFESSEADLQDIEATYRNSGGLFMLVEDQDGQLLGTFAVQRLDAVTCKLRKMYLVPEARGRGLGRYMLDQALQDARRLGYTRMIIETVRVLEAAIRLYTRAGFVPVQQEAGSPRCDQVFALDLE
jgi:putative acetyltransferase